MKTREIMMYCNRRLDPVNFEDPKPNIAEGKLFLKYQTQKAKYTEH